MRTYAPVVSHLLTCAVIAALLGALAWALADTMAYGVGVAAAAVLLGLATAPWPRRDARPRRQATGASTSRSAGMPSASSTRARSRR